MDELRENTAPEEQESREVVGWYTPRQGREVVGCYVQREALPPQIRPPEEAPKRSRRGLWIFFAALALVLILAAVALLLRIRDGQVLPWEKEDEASSIVNISSGSDTDIPLDTNYTDTRLAIQEEHGEVLPPQDLYVKCNPSTVLVVAERSSGSASLGTGIIMTEDGYIITNAHVIAGGSNCWIALDTGETFDALLVGYDAAEDIAVLKVQDAHDLPFAEFGDSERIMVGDTVYAIGNPLGIDLRGTMTEGIISAINRSVTLDGSTLSVIQTTAPLNDGNSGGPLFNRYGQVIGINTLKMTSSGLVSASTIEGLGFALPISEACFVINDIIATGSFRGAPMLGVTVTTVSTTDGSTAVMIHEVVEGFDAHEQGLQPEDVILKANGRDLYTTADLLAVRRQCRIDDTMELEIYRSGEVFTVSITLRPETSE